MPNSLSPSLFLVVLGGREKGVHIELHDVRWAIGNKIEDTYDQLRSQWFGIQKGLHIDSYMKVLYVDGYEIKLTKDNKGKKLSGQIKLSETSSTSLFII